eukprot:6187981-Pleurochrysis_carterae.AAC.2
MDIEEVARNDCVSLQSEAQLALGLPSEGRAAWPLSRVSADSLKLSATASCARPLSALATAAAAARVTPTMKEEPSPMRSSSAHVNGRAAPGCR